MIFILEDDDSIRELVVYTLEKTGFEAEGFSSPENFWSAVKESQPELAILDVSLPHEDGLSVLRRLRAWTPTSKLPVIMLTAKDKEYDKVRGLDMGADDYITKPVGMMELMARVRSLLRRVGDRASDAMEYRSGGLFVSIPNRSVTLDGEDITLTRKEFDLLAYLLANKGRAMSRGQMLAAVWDYEYNFETRTVDTHVQSLRSKLGDAAGIIKTVRGIGYKAAI